MMPSFRVQRDKIQNTVHKTFDRQLAWSSSSFLKQGVPYNMLSSNPGLPASADATQKKSLQ
jgi:hypothetical protein